MAKKKNSFNTVTPLSKTLAMILFILFPFVGFYLGIQHQKKLSLPLDSITQTTNVPNDWKSYSNTKYNFTVSYPPTGEWGEGQPDGSMKNPQTAPVIPNTDQKTPISETDSVYFELDAPIYQLPLFYISVQPDPAGTTRDEDIYESLPQVTIDKIFALPVGGALDKETSIEIGAMLTTSPGVYTRLPDENINGLDFLVIDNPHAYGGESRRLFLKRNGKMYMMGTTYNTAQNLKEFEHFSSSFKFTK